MQADTESATADRDDRPLPSLLRNISWLGVANVAVKPFWFIFVTALCMRLLGVREYGIMNAALSLTMIAVSFVNLGMTRYTVREVSREPDRASRYFSNFIALRIGNSFLAWIGAIGVALLLSYSGHALAAVVFGGLYSVALNVTAYCRGMYQAMQDLKQEAVMLILEKVLVLSGGLLLLITTRTAHWTLAGMAAGMMITTVVNVWWIDRRLAQLTFRLLSWRFLKRSVRTMIPFGLAALFTAVYYRIDMVMIEAMLGETPTGQYGAAFRILEALNMLPAIVATAAVYPRLARFQGDGDRRGFVKLLKMSLSGLAGISLIVTVALVFLAPFVITLLDPNPEYAPAVPALQILLWSFPFFCANTLLYLTLLTLEDQHFISVSLFAAVVVNIGLNVFAIPAYGINGAALATIAPEVVLSAIYAFRLRSKMNGTHFGSGQ